MANIRIFCWRMLIFWSLMTFELYCIGLVGQIRAVNCFKYAIKLVDRAAIRIRSHQIIVLVQLQVASSQTTFNHTHSFRIIFNSSSSNKSAVCYLLKFDLLKTYFLCYLYSKMLRKKSKNLTQRFSCMNGVHTQR